MNEQRDMRVGQEPESGEHRHPIPARRLVRWVTVLTVGIVAVLAVWQDSLG